MRFGETILASSRTWYALLALVPAGLLAFGYYLQYGQGLEPCPLCIFQRLAYMAVVAIAIAGVVAAPAGRGRLVLDLLIVLAAGTGTALAGRQVWLQHLPADQVPECGPGLDFMLDAFPLQDTVRMVLSGSGECAQVDWTFLGFSIAEWSLCCFVLLFLAAAADAALRR